MVRGLIANSWAGLHPAVPPCPVARPTLHSHRKSPLTPPSLQLTFSCSPLACKLPTHSVLSMQALYCRWLSCLGSGRKGLCCLTLGIRTALDPAYGSATVICVVRDSGTIGVWEGSRLAGKSVQFLSSPVPPASPTPQHCPSPSSLSLKPTRGSP